MRILQVVSSMNPDTGGVCQGIRNTLPALQRLNCDSEVVCLDEGDATYGMVDSFPVVRLGARRSPWSYSRHLGRWLNSTLPKYDAVVTNGLWLYQSFAVSHAVARLKRSRRSTTPRVFIMPHGMLDPWFQLDPSRRLKALRNWLYWKFIESRVISQADGVLFTCQRELELARKTFSPYQPRREINIGYGVPDPPVYSAAMDGAFHSVCPDLQGRNYLLFISRIDPKKGVDLLLRAYAKVAAERSSESQLPALVIAGPNDSSYALQMQTLARELGLCQPPTKPGIDYPLVCFPGMLRDDAKWGAFYNCDAMVLPSHQENFGIVVAEALACGKPVLISDQVNISDEIVADQAGLVGSDTEEGTLNLLRRWIRVPADAKQTYSIGARACYENHFLPERAASSLLNAISNKGTDRCE